MAIQFNSNIDEELEKFVQLKELINELNSANFEAEKIFVDMDYIAKLWKCSPRKHCLRIQGNSQERERLKVSGITRNRYESFRNWR